MASYAEEYRKRNQGKMQDRDAYIGALEEKVKVMSSSSGDLKILNDRLTEVGQQVVSLDGKVVHLTKLHRLGQSLIDSQDEEYNKDKQLIFSKIERLEAVFGELASQLEKKSKDLFQEGAIERLDNETKWLKKQLQSKHASLSEMIQKEISEMANRDRQSLQQLEDLADVVQHEIRRREGVESEIVDLIQALKDNSKKLEEQIVSQEGKLTGKIKYSEDNTKSNIEDSIRLLQSEMRSKQDDMEKRMKEIERERHVMQDQFAKLSSTLSDSNHSLSSAQHSLQRDTEDMLRETKRDRGRIEDAIITLREEAKDTKKEQLHLAEDLMERVNDTLRRQQAESLNFELKDGSKFQRELERVFEELDQISIKQKLHDKTLQKLTLAQTTLWSEFEQEMAQKIENVELQQARFGREISQKVEDGVHATQAELVEAAKIEKRTALRVEDCLEQVSGLSAQVQQYLMTQEPQTQSRAGGSPDSSKIAAVERKMKENIFKMYDDLRARNDEFHQEERELLRGYDVRIGECTEKINSLIDSNAKTRVDIQHKIDKCVKAVNSLQSEQLNISKISHIPENNDPTSLNVSALKNMLAEEKIKMDKKHKNTNSNNNNNNQQDGEERISEFATSPKRTEMTEKQVRKRLINERVGEKENDDTNNISINNSNINNKNNERETSFSRPFEYREAKEHITENNQRLRSSFDARLALTEDLARKTFGDYKIPDSKKPPPPATLHPPAMSSAPSGRRGHPTPPSKRGRHVDDLSLPPSFNSLGISSPPPAPIGHSHFHKKPRSVTPPQRGKSPRVISPPRVSPMLAKLQNAAKVSPTKGQSTTKPKSATNPTKSKTGQPTKAQSPTNPEKETGSLAKGVSSPSQEKQTQRRLRDLYRELKALNYDADEL